MEGEHIRGGRILVNDHWGTSRGYRQFVLCHEVGHALGLWHRKTGDSCLNEGQHPGVRDLSELGTIYDGSDSSYSPCTSGCSTLVTGEAAVGRVPFARDNRRADTSLGR